MARELRATGARVLVLDRYEIGERQTSACAAPTAWLVNLGLEAAILQTFDTLLVHTPGTDGALADAWTFSTFDYRGSASCCGSSAAPAPSSRPPRSTGARGDASTPTAATCARR